VSVGITPWKSIKGLINVKNIEQKGTWKLPGSIDIYTLLEQGEPSLKSPSSSSSRSHSLTLPQIPILVHQPLF
jgi:hypothetical protein